MLNSFVLIVFTATIHVTLSDSTSSHSPSFLLLCFLTILSLSLLILGISGVSLITVLTLISCFLSLSSSSVRFVASYPFVSLFFCCCLLSFFLPHHDISDTRCAPKLDLRITFIGQTPPYVSSQLSSVWRPIVLSSRPSLSAPYHCSHWCEVTIQK